MMRDVNPGNRSELQKVAYSSGNLAVNLMSQAFATYLVYYYVDVLGVRPAWISLAMVFHGVLNAVLNPLFGHLSDRTRSRFGRRLPYIGFGLVPLAAAFALLWTRRRPGMGLFSILWGP
ncbi:hypothetical protein HMSSN139_53550 [Paenibacillus sp. HMSSN-139]|nr:hypothetical protein HMSSN139_53550 [Paenibacillus sp. HMSSN-139]